MDAVQEEEAPYWVAGESVMTESPRRFSVFFGCEYLRCGSNKRLISIAARRRRLRLDIGRHSV